MKNYTLTVLENGDVEIILRDKQGEVYTKFDATRISEMSVEVQEAYQEALEAATAPESTVEVPEEDDSTDLTGVDEEPLGGDEEVDTFRNFLSGINIRSTQQWAEEERPLNRGVFEVLRTVVEYKRMAWLFHRKDSVGEYLPQTEEARTRLLEMGVDPDSPDAPWQYAALIVSPIAAKAALLALSGKGLPTTYAPGGWKVREGKGWTDTSLDFHLWKPHHSEFLDSPYQTPSRFNSDEALGEGLMDELFGPMTAYRADFRAGRYYRSDQGDPMYDGGEGVVGYYSDGDLWDQKRMDSMLVIPYISLPPVWVEVRGKKKRVFPKMTQPYIKRHLSKDEVDALAGGNCQDKPEYINPWVDGWALDVSLSKGDKPVWSYKARKELRIWTKLDQLHRMKAEQASHISTLERGSAEFGEAQMMYASMDWWFSTLLKVYRTYVGEAKLSWNNSLYKEAVVGVDYHRLPHRVHYRTFQVPLVKTSHVLLAQYPVLLAQSKKTGVSVQELAEGMVPKTIVHTLFSPISVYNMVDAVKEARLQRIKDKQKKQAKPQKAQPDLPEVRFN